MLKIDQKEFTNTKPYQEYCGKPCQNNSKGTGYGDGDGNGALMYNRLDIGYGSAYEIVFNNIKDYDKNIGFGYGYGNGKKLDIGLDI